VLIYNVVEGAPGDRAGLRSGDIVVQVDGAKTLDPNDVERELVKLKPDGVLTLKIQRGRKLVDVKVKLAELPPKIENLPQGII
jgi:S1-C subfamily serine protease